MVSAPVRRQQIAYVCQRGRSLRRACALLSVARSTARYESRLVARDVPVVAAMHEFAAQYPRYGYRRIQLFLARRGHVMSADRAQTLWRLHRLQVPRNRPRHLRSDNGPEFVSRAVLKWLMQADIDTAPIDQGKPWQNGSSGPLLRLGCARGGLDAFAVCGRVRPSLRGLLLPICSGFAEIRAEFAFGAARERLATCRS